MTSALSSGRSARRLASMAEALRPARPPYYVRHPVPLAQADLYPAPGWYWLPDGGARPEWLGASELLAARTLERILDRILADEDDER